MSRPNQSQDDWGVRLADLRLPRWWALWTIVMLVATRRKQHQELDEAVASMSDLAAVLAQRWHEGDERERQMLRLTGRLERLTWAVLGLGTATLVVTAWAILHG